MGRNNPKKPEANPGPIRPGTRYYRRLKELKRILGQFIY